MNDNKERNIQRTLEQLNSPNMKEVWTVYEIKWSSWKHWTMLSRKKPLCLLVLKEIIYCAKEMATAFAMKQEDYSCSGGPFCHHRSDLGMNSHVLCKLQTGDLEETGSTTLVREGQASASRGSNPGYLWEDGKKKWKAYDGALIVLPCPIILCVSVRVYTYICIYKHAKIYKHTHT